MSTAIRASLASGLVLISACSGREKKSEEAPAAASAPNEITITAKDFSFDAPDTVPSGLARIRLVNQGPNLHHVQLIRLEGGLTMKDLAAAMKPGSALPSGMVDVGGPNPPVPGAETVAWLTLDPGTYALICVVDTPDHVPHVMKGMQKTLIVTPSATASAPEPVSDATIVLSDFAFGFDSLKAGKHTIRIDNSGPQSHELFLIQFAPGKTMEDLVKWAATYKGAPPGMPMGGVSAIHAGARAFIEVDLPAGNYGVLCFVPDSKDGKPHAEHGMARSFVVN